MKAEENRLWTVLTIISGTLQAELLRGLLEAQGIQVILSQEGAGRAYGLSVGPLGEVKILVPDNQHREAEAILQGYYRGDYEELSDFD